MGENEQKYTIQRDLLCESSLFFSKAVKEEWKEGQERTIPMPDDDPAVFDLYAQWMYCGKILSRDSTLETGRGSGEPDLLVNAFVFGEKIQDVLFVDTILDALIMYTNTPDKEGSRWFPVGSTVRRA